jgi:hypothetical protein
VPRVKDRCRRGPIPVFAPAARRPTPSLTQACREGSLKAALTGQTRIRVSHAADAQMTEINCMIDEMIAAEKTEQEIRTAICKQYEPYDAMPEFEEGFADYQKSQWNKDYKGVAAQAYDRGANAAMWLWQAQRRMKPAAK